MYGFQNSEGLFTSAQMSPAQGAQTPPEGNTINSLSDSNLIMFAKLAGSQELRLKFKQGEVTGPKVELDLTMGAFTVFLSPRQVHVLVELAHGLASPDLEDSSNVAPRTCTEKPMAGSDFNRVERELLHQINPTQGLKTMDLRNTAGWSTASIDESDNEEEFLPMRLPGTNSMMNDSLNSNNMSMDGSIASSVSSKSSVTNVTKHHKHRNNAETDPTAESSVFRIRLTSIAMVLLHEDILTSCIENYGLTMASVKQMKSTADEFFRKLGVFAATGYGNKDFEKASKLVLNACQLSHIRLLAAPLVIEGSEKTTAQSSAISGQLSLASLDLVECLVDSSDARTNETPQTEFVELLCFPKDSGTPSSGISNRTDFKLRFKHTEKAVRHAQTTKFAHPRTEFK